MGGAQAGHHASQLDDAAGVTTITDHLVNAGGAQPRILVQGLADELGVRIHGRRTQRLRVAETLHFDGIAHRVGMHAQFAGDGADLPVFGVEIAANLRTGFGTNHRQTSPSSWNAREWVNEMRGSTTDPAAQAYAGQFFRPAG